ncbi:DUF2970 domain-containing protein [Ramlibacter sp. H39-3-26]|uniref:DUF2970 domain-containing protein n=1 Tax=Curvibacter soli TaxID=3031331 RepID=UPI0023D9A7AF|nr:DUF2970 domain-containing protein [Ramlibacter sp. H39-3-26]MDF1484829.1 DUF2970 domain-containing protein [Ramlibacter sp. H39-3-26]
MSGGTEPVTPAAARKGSPWRTLRAVAWSFIGLRKDSEYRADMERLNPIHIIVAGLVGALLFVLALVALVHWVVAK